MTTLDTRPGTAAALAEDVARRAPRRRVSPERTAAVLTLVALGVLACVAVARVDISIPNIIASWSNAEHFFQRVGTVRFPAAPVLLQQTALTVGLVLLGTLLAAALSVPVAYLAAANTSPGRGWVAAARFVSVLTRAVPDVVLAMVFVLVFTIGPLPGILAIGIHSVGMISKLFADAIEQIDEGPRNAIRAAGGAVRSSSPPGCSRRCCRRGSRRSCTATTSTCAGRSSSGTSASSASAARCPSRSSRSTTHSASGTPSSSSGCAS